jgi:hypothetical protein
MTFEQLKERQREIWGSAPWERVAEMLAPLLGDSPGAVSPDTQGPQCVSLTDARAEQDRESPQDRLVFLSDVVLRAGSREAERDVTRLQRVDRNADLLAQFCKRPVSPRVAPRSALQVPQREMPGGVGRSERLKIQSLRLEYSDHPCPHDVTAKESPVFGL